MANDPVLFTPESWADASPSEGLVLQAGTRIGGKYCLLRPAGFGGMGAVWVARNEATNAEVALKVLLADGAGVDAEAAARFRREAHAAAQLYHRGIVRIFDLIELTGDDEGTLVMVMELLRGETLANIIDKRRKFTLDETLSIMLPLLSALAHAHAAGIVHRDLKPENVFLAVDPDGHMIPKILDFGISKLTAPHVPKITTDGAMLGTPNYMSPEQARGSADVDARSDVFAAGILLYEMLAGQNPFANGSYHSVVAAILEREPPPLTSVPPEVWRVIRRALDKVPQIRFADASDLATALRDAAQRIGVSTPEASGAYPAVSQSIADRSVPPAPYREPELTIPSVYVKGKRRARLGAVVAIVVGALLVLVAAVVARVTRAPNEASRAATILPVSTPPPQTVPATPAPTRADGVAATVATTTATTAATAATARSPMPAVTTAPRESTQPAPPPPSSRARSTTHGPVRTSAPVAAPAPASSPAPSTELTPPAPPAPAPKPTSVVRDPGF